MFPRQLLEGREHILDEDESAVSLLGIFLFINDGKGTTLFKSHSGKLVPIERRPLQGEEKGSGRAIARVRRNLRVSQV